MHIKRFLSPPTVFVGGFIFIIFLHFPFFLLSKESYIHIHDNLDSDFVYLHLLKISNNLFGWDSSILVPNIFNGIKRGYFHSECSFIRVLFYFFPSFWAYIINSIVIRVIGFIGILLLARDYFDISTPNKTNEFQLIHLLIAVVYVLLPVYSIYGITVLGQPLLLWAFLNLIYSKRTLISLWIIVLFPFYSSFAFCGPFMVGASFLLGIGWKIYHKKSISIIYWIGILLLTGSFLVANHSIISMFLFSEELSHRVDSTLKTSSVLNILIEISKRIRYGQYHSAILNLYLFWLMVIYAIVIKKDRRLLLLGLVFCMIFIPIFDSAYRTVVQNYLSNLKFLTSFQFNRLVVLYPTIVFVVFFLLFENAKLNRKFICLSLVFILAKDLKFHEIEYNWINWATNRERVMSTYPSFQAFYSEELYTNIKKYINKPLKDYRVASVGMHPAIAQYNGFYTIDSYQNNYPLYYKKQFRKIIEKEIEKNPVLKQSFDGRGNMCYLFSDTLAKTCKFDCHKNISINEIFVDLNITELKEQSVEYIFSALPIKHRTIPLVLDKVFTDEKSRWKIYLYKL